MKIPLYHVDAFTDQIFSGNPAAVCLLKDWLPEKLMLQIARENNLSETAFCVVDSGMCGLKWFTPEQEVDLCGHATLATAAVLCEQLLIPENTVRFSTISGILEVERQGDLYAMRLPVRLGKAIPIPERLVKAVGMAPMEAYRARDLMLVYQTEEEVRSIRPDAVRLRKSAEFGIVVTARGKQVDFVSRYFAPSCGVLEDPVTGSSHCTLVPYWAKVLGKTQLVAQQLSHRGGTLYCTDGENRITVSGRTMLFSRGEIEIDYEP